VITDAAPSADQELRTRQRRYAALMAIHLVGLAVGGALYERAWGLGLAILIITGPLPWVAVILANGAPRRWRRRRPLRPRLSRGAPSHRVILPTVSPKTPQVPVLEPRERRTYEHRR